MNLRARIRDLIQRFRRTHRIVKRISLAVTISMVTITIVTFAFSMMMARVPEYRLQMQAWISEHAKLDVQFAELSARWYRFGPQLEFTDAVIRSRDGKRILAFAKSGSLGFDLWTAIRTARLTALQFSLRGTELNAIRKPNGVFEIVGQSDLPEYEHHEAFQLESLPVGRVSISDVRLVFRDLKTKRGPWIVDNVDLSILRDNNSFEVQGKATLPGMMGKQLKFKATGKGGLDNVSLLQWHAQATGDGINLRGWAQVMPDDWIAPREGKGEFKVSADFLGAHLQAFSGDIDFHEVVMHLPTWKTPLPVADTLHIREDDETKAPIATDASATPIVTAPPIHYSDVKVVFSTVLTSEGWQTHFSNLQLSQEHVPWHASTATLLIKLANVRERAASSSSSQSLSPSSLSSNSSHDDDSEVSERRVVERLEAGAQLVVLDNLWPLLAYLPESEKLAKVRALNATGKIENVAVRYERDLIASAAPDENSDVTAADSVSDVNRDSPDAADIVAMSAPRYSFRADFSDIGISPVARSPGVSGISGSVEGTGARGSVRLDSRDVEVALPHLFRTPLPADHVTGTFKWTRTTNNTHLESQDIVVKSPNGDATAKFSLEAPKGSSPVIEMHAQGTNLEAVSAPRYMPAGAMHRKVLEWLDNAFVGGRVKKAELTLTGPLQKFPFHDNEGLFLITADIEDLGLHYQQGWMDATGLQVQAEFRNMGFSATASSGVINGMTIDSASGGIADYREAQLRIKGQVHGNLDQGLHYMQQSPVGPVIGGLFQQVIGKGAMQAQATLFLPFKEMAKRQIDVDVRMQDSTIGLASSSQQATQVNGKFHIANDSVTGVNLQGQFLRGSLNAFSSSEHGNNVVVTGHAQAAPLAEFLRLPAFVRIDGEMNYRLTAPGYVQRDANGKRLLFSVDSDLMGLALNMPAPVTKPVNTARSIHVDAELLGGDLMQLRGSHDMLRTLVRLQQDKQGWHFDRAGLRVDGVAAALPGEPGLRIEGTLAELKLDDWLKLGEASSQDKTTQEKAGTEKTGIAGSTTHVQDILRSANVNVGKLHLYGFDWQDIRAVLQASDDSWRVDVAGDKATGQINVPYAFDTRPLIIDMDKLALISSSDSDHAASASPGKQQLDPRELPALQVSVRDFYFGEHGLGSLQLHADKTPQGLQVDNIQLDSDTFKGNGSGSWLQGISGPVNTLDFAIESTDVRKTLQMLHYTDFVGAKHGRLQASLSWPGGLNEDLLGRSSGHIELQLEDGQLLTVQPGAGRMLGLMSIAELPRRLRLDFRDVTDKGLAFDSIHATFEVKDGNAVTPNLLLRGPVAEIGIAGRIGLGTHDYDQTAVVTGDVGSALPVAGVALANPVVGGALWLFSQIFKEPLKGIARAYYHISGSWDNPKVERIDPVAGRASMLNSQASSSASSASASMPGSPAPATAASH